MAETTPSTPEALARLDMSLIDVMMTQRAVRRVYPDPIDDEILMKCIEVALHAPTGANGQNWEFIVIKDYATKKKLAKRYRQAWNLYYHAVIRRVSKRDPSMAKTARAVDLVVRQILLFNGTGFGVNYITGPAATTSTRTTARAAL